MRLIKLQMQWALHENTAAAKGIDHFLLHCVQVISFFRTFFFGLVLDAYCTRSQ